MSATDVVVLLTWLDIVLDNKLGKVVGSEETKPYSAITVTNWAIYHGNVWGKQIRGTDMTTSLIPHLYINVVLPVVNDREWCSALIDWLLLVNH